MASRKRIGLYYESYSNLPAFVIYMQNLVRTLLLTPDIEKPHLVILHLPDSPVDELKRINYPYIEFYMLKDVYKSLSKRLVNKVSRKLISKNISPFFDKTFPNNLDTIFPYNFRPESNYVKNKIIWKPDFQEFHLPIYFSAQELEEHKAYLDGISKTKVKLVLSSQDSKRDYERYYPNHVNDIHIWPFTSFLPDYSKVNINDLLKKYAVSKKYFVVANQFWPHKNHLNVLKALLECTKRSKDFQIVFTGKQKSSRDKDLFLKLKTFIAHNGLTEQVVFTGFIEREEQIALMANSIAVIQPSTFEGWSTVIEDCKALNHFVVASHLSVNKEQIKENVFFFDPYNYKELSSIILNLLQKPPQKRNFNYYKDIETFNKVITKSLNAS